MRERRGWELVSTEEVEKENCVWFMNNPFVNKGASAWGWSLVFRFRSKSVPQNTAYACGFDLRSNSVPQQVAQEQQEHEIKPFKLVLYWRQ